MNPVLIMLLISFLAVWTVQAIDNRLTRWLPRTTR